MKYGDDGASLKWASWKVCLNTACANGNVQMNLSLNTGKLLTFWKLVTDIMNLMYIL